MSHKNECPCPQQPTIYPYKQDVIYLFNYCLIDLLSTVQITKAAC